jgi:hypothetical protein
MINGGVSSSYQDPFGLVDKPVGREFILRFGAVDASQAYRRGRVRSVLNQMPVADVDLDPISPAIPLIDYASTVTVSSQEGDVEAPRFTGFALRAIPEGGHLRVHCETAPGFTERRIAGLSHAHIPATDLVYALCRGAGLRDDKIQIEGLDELPVEIFEVAVPVSGMAVNLPVSVGAVRLVPAPGGMAAVRHLADSTLRKEFTAAATYAICYTTAARMLDAESTGLGEIDTALSWLTVRARYSLAVLPDRSVPAWSRDSILASPMRGPLVAVRGLRSQRSWLRVPTLPLRQGDLDLTETTARMLHPALSGQVSVTTRQALLACARAATETDPISRVTALWEAIECYIGDSSVPNMFTATELREIKEALPKRLGAAKHDRLMQVFGRLNDAPLLARLRYRLASDGVPITEEECSLLKQLREIRNDVVHGRTPDPPADDQLTQGIAIVARMLVHRIHETASA